MLRKPRLQFHPLHRPEVSINLFSPIKISSQWLHTQAHTVNKGLKSQLNVLVFFHSVWTPTHFAIDCFPSLFFPFSLSLSSSPFFVFLPFIFSSSFLYFSFFHYQLISTIISVHEDAPPRTLNSSVDRVRHSVNICGKIDHGCVYNPVGHMGGDQRKAVQNILSPSTMENLGYEFRSSGLAAVLLPVEIFHWPFGYTFFLKKKKSCFYFVGNHSGVTSAAILAAAGS